jgi:hypothetical protein
MIECGAAVAALPQHGREMFSKPPRQITDIAQECARIFDFAAANLGNDLAGSSLLDLVVDSVAGVSLRDLKTAIIVSGIYSRASKRIQTSICKYDIA